MSGTALRTGGMADGELGAQSHFYFRRPRNLHFRSGLHSSSPGNVSFAAFRASGMKRSRSAALLVSEKCLFLTARGDIGYTLKTPYRDGTRRSSPSGRFLRFAQTAPIVRRRYSCDLRAAGFHRPAGRTHGRALPERFLPPANRTQANPCARPAAATESDPLPRGVCTQ